MRGEAEGRTIPLLHVALQAERDLQASSFAQTQALSTQAKLTGSAQSGVERQATHVLVSSLHFGVEGDEVQSNTAEPL